MKRPARVVSLMFAVAAVGGCAGSDSGPEGERVPIAEVVASPGGIGAVPDDGRGCPTTFLLASEKTATEVRLTLTSVRAEGSRSCVAVPVAHLGEAVGDRSIVDTTSGRRFSLPPSTGSPDAGVSVR